MCPVSTNNPLTISDKAADLKLYKNLSNKGAIIRQVVNKREVLQVHPSTIESRRLMTRLLDSKKLEYFSCRLPEDRTLKVIIRALPLMLDLEEIKADLTEKSLEVTKICRPTRKTDKGRTEMPLVLVDLLRKSVVREPTGDKSRCPNGTM